VPIISFADKKKYGTWNEMSASGPVLLATVAGEIANYEFLGVKEVGW
jgi:hypothetical protein